MVASSALAASMLMMVEPAGWGLDGVWWSLAVLMLARAATLGWRYQSADGPLPPTLTDAVAYVAQCGTSVREGGSEADVVDTISSSLGNEGPAHTSDIGMGSSGSARQKLGVQAERQKRTKHAFKKIHNGFECDIAEVTSGQRAITSKPATLNKRDADNRHD